jgi:CheY-like chemotaxis protein
VLSAPDGQEALRIVSREGSVDLLLTDVIMPGMNGPALAKQVRSLRPRTKILYMTGYSGEFIRADMLTPGVSFIPKPFTPADLGRKILKLLSDPREAAGDPAALRQQADKGRKAASAQDVVRSLHQQRSQIAIAFLAVDAIFKIVTAVALVTGEWFALYQYFETREAEDKTRNIELKKPFLEKRLEVCMRATEDSAIAVLPWLNHGRIPIEAYSLDLART